MMVDAYAQGENNDPDAPWGPTNEDEYPEGYGVSDSEFEGTEDDEDYEDYYDWQPSCLMDCEICGCHGCIPECDYYSGDEEVVDDEEYGSY